MTNRIDKPVWLSLAYCLTIYALILWFGNPLVGACWIFACLWMTVPPEQKQLRMRVAIVWVVLSLLALTSLNGASL